MFDLKYQMLCYNFAVAGWQSGYAAACKAVHAGSIPASASIYLNIFEYKKV